MINKCEVPILYLYNSVDEVINQYNINKNNPVEKETTAIMKKFLEIQTEIKTIKSSDNPKLTQTGIQKLDLINLLINKFLNDKKDKILDVIKQYNADKIATLIPFTELSIQFEKAKKAAAENGELVSSNIQNYYITDPEKLLEIAKIAAAQSGTGVSRYIQNYGIKDSTQLVEIAKIAAAKSGYGVSQYIKNYGIKDPKTLFEIATIAAAQNGTGTSRHIKNYDITDEALLFAIAKIAAIQTGQGVSTLIQEYNIKDPDKLFEIAKIAAAQNGAGVSRNIQNYGIEDPDRLFEIAKLAAFENGYCTSQYIQRYGIKDPIKLIEIAKACAASSGFGISNCIENYSIENSEILFEIAKIAAENDGEGTSLYINNYGIKDPEKLFEIAMISARSSGTGTSTYILNYGIKDPKKLLEIAKTAFLQTLEERILNNEPIPDQFCGIETNSLFLNTAIGQIGLKLFNFPEKDLLPEDKLILDDLCDLIKQNSPDKERTKILVQKWLGYYLLKQQAWAASKSAHKREALSIYPLLKAISKLRNPPMRYNLTKLLFKHLFYAEKLESLEVYKHLTDKSHPGISMGTTDRSIFSLLLTPLMCQNTESLSDADFSHLFKEWKTVLSTLSEKTYKDATVQMPVITSLYWLINEQNLTFEEKSRLVRAIFSLDGVESAKEKISIINRNLRFLEGIILSNRGIELKKLVTPIEKDNFSKDSLSKCMQEIFMGIIGEVEIKEFSEKFDNTFLAGREPQAFITYVNKLQSLPESQRKEIMPSIKTLFTDILEGNHHRNRYSSNLSKHLKTVFSWRSDKAERKAWKKIWRSGKSSPLKAIDHHTGQAENVVRFLKEKINDNHIPLLTDSILMKCLERPKEADQKFKELDEVIFKKGETNENLLQKALLSLIISNTKEEREVFLNTAIDLLQKLYPGQNDHQFLRDLKDLKKIIEAKMISKEGWTVEDSDHWEDLLLCGTEVLGSCQSINGDPNLNKCLIDYITDGKNRAVVIKDADGYIQARVIIRLLWDSKLMRPVLYRERLYKAAGISDDCIQDLEEMCISKARALGISLVKEVQEGEENNSYASYPNVLESLNGRAPFEYVDAASLGITNGKFIIPCTNSCVLFNPN